MTVYLHLGVFKTATTLFQKLIKLNKNELFKQSICPVPRNFVVKTSDNVVENKYGLIKRVLKTTANETSNVPSVEFNSIELSRLYKNEFRQKIPMLVKIDDLESEQAIKIINEIRNSVNKFRNNCTDIVVSDESLLGVRQRIGIKLYKDARKRMLILKSIFRGEDIKVILYLREHASYIESSYIQDIHEKKICSFDEYINAIGIKNLSWKPLVETIANEVGCENLIVKKFERISDDYDFFVNDFFSLFCDSKKLTLKKYQTNTSFSKKAVQIATAIAPYVDDVEWKYFRKVLQNKFNSKKYPKMELISPEMRSEIKNFYNGEIDYLVEKYKIFS